MNQKKTAVIVATVITIALSALGIITDNEAFSKVKLDQVLIIVEPIVELMQ